MNSNSKSWHDNLFFRILLGLIIPSIILAVWHISAAKSVVIPAIGDVVDILLHPFRDPPHLDCRPLFPTAMISLTRVLIGFTVAALTAIPLGLLIGRSKIADRMFSPLIEILRPICPIAWIPVAIIVFKFTSIGSMIWGDKAWRYDFLSQIQIAMIFIIWWGAFFPILLNTISGVIGVRRIHLETARMLGASDRQMFFKVVLPAAMPSIMTGLRVGMGLAWMVIVAAEFFPGTSSGLGYMITTAHQVAQYEYAFASIVIIGLIGLLINFGMLALSRHFGRWAAKER